MLNFRFLNYKHYDTFLHDLEEGNISLDSIAFIQEGDGRIWARGKEYVFGGGSGDDTNSQRLLGLETRLTQLETVISQLLTSITQLEAKINEYHPVTEPEPTPTPTPTNPAYSVMTTKPTVNSIAQAVDTTAAKPTSSVLINMSNTLSRPTDCWLVYPLSWERIENGIVVNPVIVDPNGFEMGAYPDDDTPTLTVNNVVYRILYTELGKSNYSIYFNR